MWVDHPKTRKSMYIYFLRSQRPWSIKLLMVPMEESTRLVIVFFLSIRLCTLYANTYFHGVAAFRVRPTEKFWEENLNHMIQWGVKLMIFFVSGWFQVFIEGIGYILNTNGEMVIKCDVNINAESRVSENRGIIFLQFDSFDLGGTIVTIVGLVPVKFLWNVLYLGG